MDTARLFQSGRSQAVQLPKDDRFRGSEVAVQHFGNGVLLLLPIDEPWQTLDARHQHLHPHHQRQASGCSGVVQEVGAAGDCPATTC